MKGKEGIRESSPEPDSSGYVRPGLSMDGRPVRAQRWQAPLSLGLSSGEGDLGWPKQPHPAPVWWLIYLSLGQLCA